MSVSALLGLTAGNPLQLQLLAAIEQQARPADAAALAAAAEVAARRSRARSCGGSPRCRQTRRRWRAAWRCSRTTRRCTWRRS